MVKSEFLEKDTILCMYSGGIDSTGVLHRLMTSDEFQDYKLIVHHIHLMNRENRTKAEALAVNSILAYYRENTIRDFIYSESVFNTKGFAPLRSPRFTFDMDVCAFTAANICLARQDVRFVAMGRTKTDLEGVGDMFLDRMNRAQSIFNSQIENGNLLIPPTYIFPVVEFTKQQIWDLLPRTVSKETWWCRTPIYTDNHRPSECGKCPTCQQVNEFMNEQL